MVFVDLEKAYDSLPRVKLWKTLGEELGIPKFIVKLLQRLYCDTAASVFGSSVTPASVKINKGIK